MTKGHWRELGDAVNWRRLRMRLPQDLSDRGGPGEITIRKIERGDGEGIRAKTRGELELALDWPTGLVDAILETGLDSLGRTNIQLRHEVVAAAIHRALDLNVHPGDTLALDDENDLRSALVICGTTERPMTADPTPDDGPHHVSQWRSEPETFYANERGGLHKHPVPSGGIAAATGTEAQRATHTGTGAVASGAVAGHPAVSARNPYRAASPLARVLSELQAIDDPTSAERDAVDDVWRALSAVMAERADDRANS